MAISIRPSLSPHRELDLTAALTAAVAHELWKHCGGNEVVNWLEAERIVASLTIKRRAAPGGRHTRDSARRPRRQEPEHAAGPIPHLS